MNKIIKFHILIFIFSGLLFTGCDHETETFDGPSLIDRFGPFNVITDLAVSQAQVDFAAGETVFFSAEFNKNVNWVLEITGMESGAVKRIEGFSKSLSDENALWDGGTTELPFFTTEMCNAVLTVPEEPDYTGTATVETVSLKSYADAGVLFTDFESELGINAQIENFEFEFTPNTGRQSDIPAEGQSYFLLEGTDDVVPNFFVGLVELNSTITGEAYVPVPTSVPEELYFNCFMYSDGGPHGSAIIDFYTDTDDSGDYVQNSSDAAFRVETDYDLSSWEGWRLISHPMSDTGISQEELARLVNIRLLLISDLNAQPDPALEVGYGIDFMIFTSGGPLEL